MADISWTQETLDRTIAGGQLYFRTLLLMIASQLKSGQTENVLEGIRATIEELQGDLPPEDSMSRCQTIAALHLLRTLITTHGTEAALYALQSLLSDLQK